MPISKAQQKAVAKYQRNNYDVIQIRVPKGRREEIKQHADIKKESLNAFICRAIDETISREV
jgi:predicted HicB family RNase H-like nuclease